MAKQTIATLKHYFRTHLKPSQQQFWDWLDSFRHKDDKVLASDVDGLQSLLDQKVDKKDIAEPEVFDPEKVYTYNQDTQQYVSYVNPSSSDPQFQAEGFYRLLATTTAGQSPETNPEKWAYQGQTLGEITISDVVGLMEALNALQNTPSGSLVAVLTTIERYNTSDIKNGLVYKLVYTYYGQTNKYKEQRCNYDTSGRMILMECRDDANVTFLQYAYTWNGDILQVPTLATITAFTL